MKTLPEMWKEDFQKTAPAPDAITVIARIYNNTGISRDSKWVRSQRKIRALMQKMMRSHAVIHS
jgi:hypothetical protein